MALQVGEDIVPFAIQATAAGSARDAAQAIRQSPEAFLQELGEWIPSALIQAHPDFDPTRFIFKDGRWFVRQTTMTSARDAAEQTRGDHREHLFLDRHLRIADMAHYLKARGLTMVDGIGQDPLTDGYQTPSETIAYGGVAFHPFSNPRDPNDTKNSPAYAYLVAHVDPQTSDDPARLNFTDPDTGIHRHVSDGEILFLGSGGIAYLRDMEKVMSAQPGNSPLPYLTRTFQSPDMLRRMKGAAQWREAGPADAPLPVYLGRGADAIHGQWFQLSGEASGAVTQHWFFQAQEDGIFQSAATGKSVTVEAGSLWSLEDTALGARGYAQFLASNRPQFSRAAIPLAALNGAYAQDALSRLQDAGAVLETHDTDYRLGGQIRGQLLSAAGIDPQAPVGFVAQENGRYADPVYGLIDVNVGDVFIWMSPPIYQAQVARAMEDARAVLYREDGSVVGLARAESFNTPALGGLAYASHRRRLRQRTRAFPISDRRLFRGAAGAPARWFVTVGGPGYSHARHAGVSCSAMPKDGEQLSGCARGIIA